MSFIDVKPGDIEVFSVATTPNRTFSSSSSGVTGSVYVYSDRSTIEKDLTTSNPSWIESTFVGDSFEEELKSLQTIGQYAVKSTNKALWDAKFSGVMETYMTHVNERSRSTRRFHSIDINRWVPTPRFTQFTARKLTVKNILNRFYRVRYPSAQWAYTNYNCLNFFTSSNTPNGSALLYPMTPAPVEHSGYCTGSYIPSGAFSFDFYINPCYRTLDKTGVRLSLNNDAFLYFNIETVLPDNGQITLLTSNNIPTLLPNTVIRINLSNNDVGGTPIPGHFNHYVALNEKLPYVKVYNTTGNYAIFDIDDLLDFTTDMQMNVTYITSVGTFSYSDQLSIQFVDSTFNVVNPYVEDTSIVNVGTIFHVSSTYAVSLVPGTLKDINNKQEGFRLMLQLSQSADVTPSLAMASSNVYPNDLTFFSDDNSLRYNNWHHVVIRWGGQNINNGTGSFNIDGVDRGIFVIPSSTIAPRLFASGWQNPSVLTLGNYFESNGGVSIANNIVNFFGASSGLRDGISVSPEATLDINEPVSYKMRFPLNAELHDVSIKRYYMTDNDIIASASVGPKYIDNGHKGIAFYVPPFFTQESPLRLSIGGYGGILQTPFFEVNGTTDDPFNVAMSFGVGGHYINLENFVKDFASDVYPRLHQLTGSAISYTTAARTANDFLYDDPFVAKRNLTILPCDDGNFMPSYELLMSETLQSKFIGDVGDVDYSYISLANLLNENAQIFGTDFSQSVNGVDRTDDEIEDLANQMIGFTPENPGLQPGAVYQHYMKLVSSSIVDGTYDAGVQQGAPLTIYQRTLDNSSNQVTFFNISNIFYGDAISPKSFTLLDTGISGSNNHIKITLKDDGFGNLYRADSLTKHATWNNVGNLYYDEGVAVVKSPHLYFFGKNQFDVSFKGQRNVHVMNCTVVAGRNMLNSSSNPDWQSLKYSSAPKQHDNNFAYITHINLHDDNYNVVAKANLAQPIMKQFGSQVAFKLKLDF